MARVLKGFHGFTCTHRVHPLTEWTIPAFAFPAEAGTHLLTPEGWKAELAFRGSVANQLGITSSLLHSANTVNDAPKSITNFEERAVYVTLPFVFLRLTKYAVIFKCRINLAS